MASQIPRRPEHPRRPRQAKQGDACFQLGAHYLDASGVAKDEKRAAESFQIGCDLGARRACAGLGEAYLDGKGVGIDKAHGKELLQRACKADFKPACNRLKPAPASCNGGSWVVSCGGKCIDTYRNPFHCGNCGNTCATGFCYNGVCQ